MKNLKSAALIILLLSLIQKAYSGNDNSPTGARSAGMCKSSVTLSDSWSINNNQAGLGYLKHATIGISYEDRFLLPELSVKGLSLAFPTKSGVFGFGLSYFGYSKYNETKTVLGYSLMLGKNFSLGIGLDVLSTRIAEQYGSKGTMAGEIGIRTQPIKNLYIAAHVFNPTHAKLVSYNNERIPTILKFGIAYHFSQKVLLSTEAEKDLIAKIIYKAGVEYHILNKIYLRTGISSNPLQNSFGLGYDSGKLKMDIAFVTHQALGITPHISVNYEF
jgi:hypothetical protein